MRFTLTKWINKIIPEYAVIPLISLFVYNCLVYSGTSFLCRNLPHYDFTTALDRKVPFIEQFIIIYFLAFAFWAVNYILIGRGEKETFYRFVTADLLSRTICLVFFILIPTTNVRPELEGNSVCIQLVRFLYDIDEPANLLPSIHCLVSWFCFIGIKKRKDIARWYKLFSFIFAILIMVSTQTLKQHYLVDVIAGVAVAEITLWVANKTEWYRHVQSAFEKVNTIVGIRKNGLGSIYEKE